jgi:hypothetical protein
LSSFQSPRRIASISERVAFTSPEALSFSIYSISVVSGFAPSSLFGLLRGVFVTSDPVVVFTVICVPVDIVVHDFISSPLP